MLTMALVETMLQLYQQPASQPGSNNYYNPQSEPEDCSQGSRLRPVRAGYRGAQQRAGDELLQRQTRPLLALDSRYLLSAAYAYPATVPLPCCPVLFPEESVANRGQLLFRCTQDEAASPQRPAPV